MLPSYSSDTRLCSSGSMLMRQLHNCCNAGLTVSE